MEPRWPTKGSSHSREMRHGPSAPSMPQKDAYSRLLSQHHSSAFRAYLEQFAREQHLQTDHNRPSLAGTGALETNGCSPHPAKDTESESCLSLYMGRLNGRGGAPVLEPPGPKPGSGARRARRGERRDTNTSQDADVESSEEGLLKHPKPPKKQQHGGGGAFKTPVGDAGTSGPVGLTGGQQHNKQKHKKKNTAKNKMDAAPEGGRSAGADSSVTAAPKGYMGRVKAAQPQDQVHSAQLTPDKNKSKNKGGRGKKKQVFEAYLSLEEVSKELKRGELIQGPLRINPKKYHEAFIPSPDSTRDIFLDGVAARNRALNGDIVVVKLLPREQWKVIKSDTDGEGNGESENPAMGTSARGSTVGAKPSPDVIVEAQFSDGEDDAPGTDALAPKVETMNLQSTTGSHSSGDVKTVADKFLQRTGKVVYIAQQKHSRAATGFLKFLPDKSFAMFSPVDHRVPRVNVPLADCPADFAARPDDYASILFICRITDWPGDSTFAEGLGVAVLDLNYFIDECKITQSNVRLVKSLGLAGEIEPETEGILTEYDVDFAEFSEDVLQCLPQDLPWTIPVDEFTKRRDLRLECIFTVDPATARDLDDALSCKPLPDGNFEVGVHIADVSYFVDEGSSLDGVASRRATSVYLVQKVVPMLPRLLCEELCSLNPMTDRLTFSVIWKITPEGKILSEWFGRTVIRSCVKLSYDHAQSMIDSPDAPPGPEQLPPFAPEHPVAEIHRAVLDLHRIARRLRSQRFESGALRLDQSKLSFTLDKESGMPQGCYIYQYRDSNKLVEEFMLLANMATAHRIYRSFPEFALLRRHPPPQTKMVDDLTEFCDQMGLSLDFSSAGSLHRSLNETLGTDQYSCARKEVLTHMCSRPMQMAVYFCTGVLMDEPQFRHYALNVPFYTHFTSPIRRYADVIVHRLLGAALGCSPHPSLEAEDVQRQASHCNDKKTASKRVQELSSELFFAAFVKECGPLDSEAMVMGVLDQSFDVLVLKYGVQKRIYCKALQGLKDFHFRKVGKKPELTLVWAADETMRGPVEQEISIFTLVEVQLQADAAPMKYSATLKRPSPTGP